MQNEHWLTKKYSAVVIAIAHTCIHCAVSFPRDIWVFYSAWHKIRTFESLHEFKWIKDGKRQHYELVLLRLICLHYVDVCKSNFAQHVHFQLNFMFIIITVTIHMFICTVVAMTLFLFLFLPSIFGWNFYLQAIFFSLSPQTIHIDWRDRAIVKIITSREKKWWSMIIQWVCCSQHIAA